MKYWRATTISQSINIHNLAQHTLWSVIWQNVMYRVYRCIIAVSNRKLHDKHTLFIFLANYKHSLTILLCCPCCCCADMWSFGWKRIFNFLLIVNICRWRYHYQEGKDLDSINRFNQATCLCLSQVRTWISNGILWGERLLLALMIVVEIWIEHHCLYFHYVIINFHWQVESSTYKCRICVLHFFSNKSCKQIIIIFG